MKKNQHLISIRGAKGKGGGGSTFEADDNMFARQSAAFIDALCEGPIKGLVYGDASILIDEVRLRNVNQSTGRISQKANFNNFTVITKNGDATQVVDADFFAEYPSAATTKDIGSAELLEDEPQYFTISSGTFEKRETDYIKITVSTTGMSAITKTGDNKGDINTTVVYFHIDFQWVDNEGDHHTRQMFDTGFEGKVSGKYAHTFGFNIETIKDTSTINDWSIKVTKLAASPQSNDSTEVQNAIYVDSIEAAIADKLEYPYTAYVGGVIDAEAFNSIPARGYEIDGKLIDIPTNMYPCDYNGRKLTLSSASAFAVGNVISQTLTISSLTAAGTDAEGYTATATVPAHGVATGETFKATIATTSATDQEHWEGEFVCVAASSTTFTYTLNKPFDAATGEYKTLAGGTTCGGTKTAVMFSGGLVDKIAGNTLYLRNVSGSTSAVTGAISNGTSTGTVISASQVFIPANYRRKKSTEKPVTSEQDWDGTYYSAWCNNPAWVYHDLIVNKIYGLGNYVDSTQINKWELFQIGRYCDELVPAGVAAADLLSIHCTADTNYTPGGASGEHEPRFSANLVIGGKQEAYKVLNDVSSIFRGMAYWLNGEAFVVQDSEKDPVYQFTNANVINGEFKYEGTANKTRTNSIMVNWNNPQDYYRSRTEIVELEESLQKDNEWVKPEATTAFGCTSRGQARRLGKWKLLTNNWNTNTVTFETSLNAAFLRPGDIVQVIDQHKEGKSWGGRISSSSSTSAINIDRKPSGFGSTSVESDYAVGDYRLTLSYVGYKAILAQDTATISGTAYVRGDHLTSITTEEAALTLQDDTNNLVFVQWTPFTFTETKTVSAVSNSGKTLSVASAFNAAPDQDQVWILSRAALATGKTKQEAKLFRMMAMVEKDKNLYEITALEYNASKFDAVDKNEALTQDRQIYLPDSFKDVPAVTNLDVEPRIRKSGSGGTINSLVVDWDPATNADGTLYNSVRHYEVEFSQDGQIWHKAGTNQSTDFEITDMTVGDIAILSGTYYFKVYLVSLNGVRSPVTESGAKTIDFNRAVGPAEGSIGTTNHFINFIGNISGDFSLEAGKVTFSPQNIFHNDGVNEHAVSSQAQLDFTGLNHESTTGGNEGYVYFDHSANAFIAAAFDITSGQFYTVGADIFSTATGTLTSDNGKKWTGLDSTDFDGELSRGNVFKFTHSRSGSSVDYYHRVKEIAADWEMRSHLPSNQIITNAHNQAFAKPNLLVDYGNGGDTIMGKVTKTGADTYTLQKYGSSQGESAYGVGSTNLNFTFDANLDGEVTNESDYSCDFIIRKGGQDYTFANDEDAQHTFGLSLQARTGFDSDDDIVINATSGQVTIADTAMDTLTAATATIRIFDRGRANLLIEDKTLSFTKSSQGTAGEDAKLVVVTPSSQMMTKEIFPEERTEATLFHPTSITITAQCTNTTKNGTWSNSGGSITSNNTITNGKATATVNSTQLVDDMTITYTLHADDGGGSDTTQLHLLEMFGGSVQPVLSNPAHLLPASKTGVVSDYSGSGTRIEVYQGTDRLDYDGVGTSNGHWKVTVADTSGITEGTPTSGGTAGGRYVTIGDHSLMDNSADFKTLTYTITGKATNGTAFSFAQNQTITKSKTGQDGTAGQSVKHETIFRKNDDTIDDDVGTFASPLTGNSNWSLSMPALTANGDIAYASSRTFTSDGESPQDATWSTPIAALTRTNGTNATALTITSTDTSVAGETTLTFSDGSTFTVDDGDNGDDGDGIDVIYQNSSTALTTAPADSAGAPTGWSFTASAPEADEKTYISIGVRTKNTGSYDWSVPSAITAFDGDNGAGVNFVFARSATKPNVPTADGLNIPSADIQWYDDPPAGANTLWSSKGTVGVNGTAYAWGAVFQVEGSAVAELKCYSDVVANNGASPVKPSASTYNATTSVLTLGTSPNTSWNLTPPSVTNNGDTVYSCTVLVSGSPNDTAIAIGTGWSTPVIHTRKTDGATGDPGKQIQELRLYKLTSVWNSGGTTVASTAPTSGVYTFSTGTIASIATGWSQTKPAITSGYFIIESAALATESSSGSDTSSALSWSTASISSEGVQFTNFIFLNHDGSPGTPTATAYPDLPTNNPNSGDNWSDSPPAAVAGKQLWSSKGVAKLAGSFPTFTFNYTWETPVVHVQNKADISLDQVDNTSDADQQAATLTAATSADVGLDEVVNERQITIFRQDGIPTSLAVGDIWIDTDDGNRAYRAKIVGADQTNNDEWVSILDEGGRRARDAFALSGTTPVLKVANANTALRNDNIVAADIGGAGKAFAVLPASGATVGAVFGTNLFKTGTTNFTSDELENASIGLHADGYLTNIGTTQSLSNAKISISAAGALSGAGGGTVTAGGLGAETLELLTGGTKTITITGNKISASGSGNTAWNTHVYSKDGYPAAQVSYTISQTNKYIMVGLNSDPTTDTSYSSIDYAWYTKADGTLSIYESGTQTSTHGSYAAGDKFTVTYDGSAIRYYHNGDLERTVTVRITNNLHMDSSFYHIDSSIEKVQFSAITSNYWSDQGGRPTELTDGRVGTALTSAGVVQTTIPENKGGTGLTTAGTAIQNSKITTNADGTLNYDGTTAAAPSLASITGTVPRTAGGFGIDIDALVGNAAKVPRWNGTAWVADTPAELRGNIGAGTSNFAGGWSNLTGTIPTTVANSSISSSNVTGALGFTPGTSSFAGGWDNLTGTIPTSVANASITQAQLTSAGAVTTSNLQYDEIDISEGLIASSWVFNGTAYTPTATTVTVALSVTHPTFGTSTVVGTWTRTDLTVSGFSLGTGSGMTGTGTNTWTFGDVDTDSGSADNVFGSTTANNGLKTIYVQHSASDKRFEITAQVLSFTFTFKCLTPAMLPENLQIGDEVDSPLGKTKVIDMQYKEREGYYILEDELEITNDHPILIDGEWILAEEYAGKKEYIDKPTEVVYVETENELLTVKNWTVGGKY